MFMLKSFTDLSSSVGRKRDVILCILQFLISYVTRRVFAISNILREFWRIDNAISELLRANLSIDIQLQLLPQTREIS